MGSDYDEGEVDAFVALGVEQAHEAQAARPRFWMRLSVSFSGNGTEAHNQPGQ
jgi:hypothetical protein